MFRRIIILIFALVLAGMSAAPSDAQAYCMSVTSRLYPGAQGRVTPGLPNVVRVEPVQGNGNAILAYIPAGDVFTVLSGPACGNGITWWQVEYSGVIGWTPEGQWSTYWTEPVYTPTPTPVVCSLPPRLLPGSWARVTPGLPNRLRAEAGFSGRVLGYIPAGGYFSVLSDPVCVGNVYWYQVNYNGLIGWTAEGRGYTYWLEPW